MPGDIPSSPDYKGSLYAIVEAVSTSEYIIVIALAPGCLGGACRYGTISGQLITPKSTPLKGKTVYLKQGITGYFNDAVCGANCSDSILAWAKNGYRYSVGIKAGDLKTLVTMANSTVLNSFKR